MAGVEHLELRPHAELADPRRHRAQHRGRVDHHVVAAGGEVHRSAVERADLRAQLLDVREPLGRAGHVRSCLVRRQGRVLATEDEVAAHPRGQVEDDVDVRSADLLDDRAVEGGIARSASGVGVADVDVRNCRPRARRLDRGVRDPLGRHRDVLAAPGRIPRSGHGTSDENFPIHGILRSICELPLHILRWTYHNRAESDGAKRPHAHRRSRRAPRHRAGVRT